MKQHQVLFHRSVAVDGRSLATASSKTITANGLQTFSDQAVTVIVSVNGTTRSASSSSASSNTDD